MLPLQTRATIKGSVPESVLKVITLGEFLRSRYEPQDCALWFDASSELLASRAAQDVEWGPFTRQRTQCRPWLGSRSASCARRVSPPWFRLGM